MAHFGFALTHHTRTNGTPRAAQQAAYILRRERDYNREVAAYGWETRTLRATYEEDLTYATWAHLPVWAAENPIAFFAAADQYERANGRIASSLILTLPRDLTHAQQIALMDDWLTLQYPRHPYVVAFHTTMALDGLPYPHVHLTYSIRQTDGMDRDAAQHFRRYNPLHPDRGGAQKDRAFDAYGMLRAQRHAWSDLVNWHVERAGGASCIDPRSLHSREIPRLPEAILPGYHALKAKYDGIITPARHQVLQARQAREPLAPMEAQKAREWWAHRKALLGLTGAESSSEVVTRVGANQHLETTQFQHPGGRTPRTARTPVEAHEQALLAALRAQGRHRAMGVPLTAQMIADVHRLGLQTQQVLRHVRMDQDRSLER